MNAIDYNRIEQVSTWNRSWAIFRRRKGEKVGNVWQFVTNIWPKVCHLGVVDKLLPLLTPTTQNCSALSCPCLRSGTAISLWPHLHAGSLHDIITQVIVQHSCVIRKADVIIDSLDNILWIKGKEIFKAFPQPTAITILSPWNRHTKIK